MFIPLHDSNALRHIRVQYVTLTIIVLNTVIWLGSGTTLTGSDALGIRETIFAFGFIPGVAFGNIAMPDDFMRMPAEAYPWATFVTYSFLHGDFWHLLGNMLFIWVFGDNVEDAMGHVRFVFFYAACAAAGALLHGLIQPGSESPLIGASGAAAGIITAYVLLHPRVKVWILALGRIPIRLSALWVVGAWIGFQFLNLAIGGEDNVSWAAHVGGILAGAVLIPIVKRRGVPLFDWRPVEEVIPPMPPPAVADEGWPIPGQPEAGTRAETPPPLPWEQRKTETASAPAEPDRQEPPAPSPWGRQPREN